MSIAALMVSVSSVFWPPPSPPSREDVEVRLLAWTWEAPALALSVEAPVLQGLMSVLPAEAGRPVEDTDTVRYDLPIAALDGVSVGSAWRVLSAEGEQRCVVTGLGMIVSAGVDLGALPAEGLGAPCGAPLVFADLSCEGTGAPPMVDGVDGVAVPVSNTRARVGLRVGAPEVTSAPEGAVSALLREPATVALRAHARSLAAAKGVPLQQEVVSRVFRLGEQAVTVVDGRFYTGEGQDSCGGEDVLVGWGGLLVEGEAQPTWALSGGIWGVFDVEGDGQVEVLEWGDEGMRLRSLGGATVAHHNAEWCICGC